MNQITRRPTRLVVIGSTAIGGDEPIRIQSMTNTRTTDIKGTVRQIIELTEAGCEIVRVSVPDRPSAEAIKEIKKEIDIPLTADIHYDYRLAVQCIRNGADKIRINPGNIGGREKLKEVVMAAKEHSLPIRVGINCGSLEKDILEKHGEITAEAVLESVDRNVAVMNELDFDDLVISVKASDVMLNYKSNILVSQKYDYPLHIGITESGSDMEGIIRSSAGIAILLKEGIGDTIRVSLSNDPVEEIYAARAILNSMDIIKTGVEVISCPTCARTEVDIINIAARIKEKTRGIKKHIKVAIMGCSVNGPGESRDADIGIAGGKNEFLLFKKGSIVGKIREEAAVDTLIEEIKRMTENGKKTL